MKDDGCNCCIPGDPEPYLCQKCFMVWYDSGIIGPAYLARECRWRKAEGFWPWGEAIPTVAQIEELERRPFPKLKAPGPAWVGRHVPTPKIEDAPPLLQEEARSGIWKGYRTLPNG